MRDRIDQRLAVRLVDRRLGGHRLGDLVQDIGEQVIVKVEFGDAFVVARAHELERDPFGVGLGLEAGVAGERSDIELVGKID
jgi:hypothetical protein